MPMVDVNTADDLFMSGSSLPDGTVLLGGQFTIIRRLSAGGFGTTYLAEDNVLGRTIVLKECFPEDICVRHGHNIVVRKSDQVKMFDSITKMFMREARSLATLRHPNIVGVHRAFEENNTAYMALDLIDGTDLLDLLETDSDFLRSPVRVKEILLQLLTAIETIHEGDLLHRDISPDNIIIEKTGRPVLIDFGAARADASRRTRAISALIVVKDGYSPQELYLPGSIQTPSSDLYALASTFYHIISGGAPANSQLRMADIAQKTPDPCIPLAGRFDEYDPDFLEAIDKAMEILPKNRLQSAAEWIALIDQNAANKTSVSLVISATSPKPVAQDFERMLSKIVEETNEDVRKSEPRSPVPEPEVVVLEPKKPVPDWLREFNEESLRLDATSEQEIEPPEDETDIELETDDDAHTLEDLEVIGDDNVDVSPFVTTGFDQRSARATLEPEVMRSLAKYLFTGLAIGFVLFFMLPGFFLR